MSKIYKCSKECGNIEENDGDKIPVCCGAPMTEIKEEELFGCSGCCSRCSAKCGDGEE